MALQKQLANEKQTKPLNHCRNIWTAALLNILSEIANRTLVLYNKLFCQSIYLEYVQKYWNDLQTPIKETDYVPNDKIIVLPWLDSLKAILFGSPAGMTKNLILW